MLYEQGEDRAALDYLDSWLPTYPREGLMHCHISWHVALFALMLGDTDARLAGLRGAGPSRRRLGPGAQRRHRRAGLPVARRAGRPRPRAVAVARGPRLRAEILSQARHRLRRRAPRARLRRRRRSRRHRAYVAELEQRAASGRSPAGDVVPQLASGLAAYGDGDWAKAIAVPRAGAGRDRAHRRQPRPARPDREHAARGLSQGRPRRRRPQAARRRIPTGGPRCRSPA